MEIKSQHLIQFTIEGDNSEWNDALKYCKDNNLGYVRSGSKRTSYTTVDPERFEIVATREVGKERKMVIKPVELIGCRNSGEQE